MKCCDAPEDRRWPFWSWARTAWWALVCLLMVTAGCQAPKPSGAVSEGVRGLAEWREVSEFWVREIARAYPRESTEFRLFAARYIEASAAANSLIVQIQFDSATGTPLSYERYSPTVERARVASSALAESGKALLLPAGTAQGSSPPESPKPRGGEAWDSGGSSDAELITNQAENTVSIAGGLMDIVLGYKRQIGESNSAQRERIKEELEGKKWKSLDELVGGQ